jgi:hypothetical protein
MYFVAPPNTDAFNFFSAANITDTTQLVAVASLITDLKNYNIWNKMKAIYPMVGQAGVSSSFEVNLKNPNTFRGSFSGSWIFSSTGAKPDGNTGYMDTKLNALSNLSLNSVHLSYYSRTNVGPAGQVEMGTAYQNSTYLLFNYNGTPFGGLNANQTTRTSVANPTTGFLIGSRISSTQEKYYTNNVIQTVNNNSTAIDNRNILLGCYIDYTSNPALFSSKECAFSSIGDGLTDTEAANFYTAVQRFQTTLGRQV